MFLSTKSLAIGIAVGIIVGVLGGYFLQTQINNEEAEIGNLQSQINQKNSQIINLQSQISEKDGQISDLQSQVEILESQVPSPLPGEGEPGSSRFFPAEIGDTLTCTFEYLFKEYTGRVNVKEIVGGQAAWNMIRDANMFNDPPPIGFEYVLVRIEFTYVSGPTVDTTFDVSTYRFDVVSSDGYVYDVPMVVEPEPDISATLYPGASHEGWAAYQVYDTDTKPVLVFGRDYTGSDGIWFKLYE